MIEKSTLNFLQQLRENNHKDWFDENRSTYQNVRKNFVSLTEALLKGISTFDPGLEGIEAKRCIFRINRDIRFSKDKTPYKSNFGAAMTQGGRKSPFAGYYIHLEPEGCFLAAGSYKAPSPVIKSIREGIDYEPETLREILANPDFKQTFGGLQNIDMLKKAPKGYSPDHEAIDLLRHKSFVVSISLTEEQVLGNDFVEECLRIYQNAQPLLGFLNKAIEG